MGGGEKVFARRHTEEPVLAKIIRGRSVQHNELLPALLISRTRELDLSIRQRIAVFVDNPAGDDALRSQPEHDVLHVSSTIEGNRRSRACRGTSAIFGSDEAV